MADFGLNVRQVESAGVLDVEGYINAVGGDEIASACYKLIDEGVRHFVVNLEKCKIVNSMGVSCLIEVIEKVKELEGQVGFCCVTPTMAKTFKIMGLLQASTIYATEAEALQG